MRQPTSSCRLQTRGRVRLTSRQHHAAASDLYSLQTFPIATNSRCWTSICRRLPRRCPPIIHYPVLVYASLKPSNHSDRSACARAPRGEAQMHASSCANTGRVPGKTSTRNGKDASTSQPRAADPMSGKLIKSAHLAPGEFAHPRHITGECAGNWNWERTPHQKRVCPA